MPAIAPVKDNESAFPPLVASENVVDPFSVTAGNWSVHKLSKLSVKDAPDCR
jgi:hypothetical protein